MARRKSPIFLCFLKTPFLLFITIFAPPVPKNLISICSSIYGAASNKFYSAQTWEEKKNIPSIRLFPFFSVVFPSDSALPLNLYSLLLVLFELLSPYSTLIFFTFSKYSACRRVLMVPLILLANLNFPKV